MYIATNKANKETRFEVTDAQYQRMLTHPLSKGKFTYVQGKLPKPPDEKKKVKKEVVTNSN